MSTISYLVLVPLVYVAFAVLAAGLLWQAVRIVWGLRRSLADAVGPTRAPRRLGALAGALFFPAVLPRRPHHWIITAVLHVGLALLIVGHLEVLVGFDLSGLSAHRIPVGGGWVGIVVFVVLLFFLFRRFHSPVREISDAGNYYLLILLLLTVVFGSQLRLARTDYGYATIEVEDYQDWGASLIEFDPEIPEPLQDDMVGHTFLLVLHVFFAALFLLFFPFSKMTHAVLGFALHRLARR